MTNHLRAAPHRRRAAALLLLSTLFAALAAPTHAAAAAAGAAATPSAAADAPPRHGHTEAAAEANPHGADAAAADELQGEELEEMRKLVHKFRLATYELETESRQLRKLDGQAEEAAEGGRHADEADELAVRREQARLRVDWLQKEVTTLTAALEPYVNVTAQLAELRAPFPPAAPEGLVPEY